MDEEEPRLAVPAFSSKCEARVVDDGRRDDDRHAQRPILSGCPDRMQQVLPHHPSVGINRRGDDRTGRERREPADESRLARADPGDHATGATQVRRAPRRPPPLGVDAGGFDLEERREPERLEVAGSIHDTERAQELADPWLRRENERVVRPALLQGAERGDRQEDVAQRSGMDDERQGRRRASAASWRRPFVASAVPV